MKINVKKDEANELVLEFDTSDFSIPDLIASELLQDDGVVFAGVAKDHPETGKPTLTLKTEKRNARSALSKALESIGENVKGLGSQFTKAK